MTSNKAVIPPLLYLLNHLVTVASLLCNNLTKSAEGATRKPKAMERKDLTVGEQKRSLTYCQQDRANENSPTIVSNSSRKSTKLLPIVIFHSDN